MKPLQYYRAAQIPDALEACGPSGARYLAGGTNLLDLLKERVTEADSLVDLTWLPEPKLSSIETTREGGLWLGALVKNARTANHPLVRQRYPLLSQAILAGASPQLRNMATNGGNLLQRTRCPYFYEVSMACNKRKPGSGCSALEGIHDNHAILGWTPACVATYPGDMANALYALDAQVHIRTPDGGLRKIRIQEFHRLPEQQPERDNLLKPGELIEGLQLPPSPFSRHYSYIKVRERASYAFALVAVAAALEMNGGAIRRASLVLGAVAHKPWRVQKAETALIGGPASLENWQQAARLALADARPLRDNGYKVELARRAIVRALRQAAESNA